MMNKYKKTKKIVEHTNWKLNVVDHNQIKKKNINIDETFTIKNKIFEMCSWYYEFEKIFDDKFNVTFSYFSKSNRSNRRNLKSLNTQNEKMNETSTIENEKKINQKITQKNNRKIIFLKWFDNDAKKKNVENDTNFELKKEIIIEKIVIVDDVFENVNTIIRIFEFEFVTTIQIFIVVVKFAKFKSNIFAIFKIDKFKFKRLTKTQKTTIVKTIRVIESNNDVKNLSTMRRKFVWRLSMTKFEMKTCLSLKDKSYVIITLQYIFRNFFVKLAIKLFTSFHTLFLTIW